MSIWEESVSRQSIITPGSLNTLNVLIDLLAI